MSSKRRGSRVYIPPKEAPVSAAVAKRRKSVSSSSSSSKTGRRKSVSRGGSSSAAASSSTTPLTIVVGLYYQLKDGRVGQIRYIGETNFAIGIWYGLQLLPQFKGRNSGSVQGTDYFKCDHKQGIFVRETSVQKRVTSKEIIVMKADYERTRRGSVDLASEVSGSAAVSPLAGTSVSPLPMLPTAVDKQEEDVASVSSITERITIDNSSSVVAGDARRGSITTERDTADSAVVEQLLIEEPTSFDSRSDAGARGSSDSHSSSTATDSVRAVAMATGSSGSLRSTSVASATSGEDNTRPALIDEDDISDIDS